LVEPTFGGIIAFILWFQLINVAHYTACKDSSFVVRARQAAVLDGFGTNLVLPGLVSYTVEVVGETGHETGFSGTV